MGVRYMKTMKQIMVGYSPGEKYLAKIIYGETVSLDKLSERVAASSSYNEGDVYNMFSLVMKQVVWSALDGCPVDLAKFGRFYPRIKARAMNTYEEVTADTIESFDIRFFPSPELKAQLKNAKFEFHEVEIKSHAPKPTPTPPTP